MEPVLGKIELFAFDYAPQGWLKCEGQLLKIEDYPQLFSLLGTTYGGDGEYNFGLPNMEGKEPAKGLNYCVCIIQQYPGERGDGGGPLT